MLGFGVLLILIPIPRLSLILSLLVGSPVFLEASLELEFEFECDLVFEFESIVLSLSGDKTYSL